MSLLELCQETASNVSTYRSANTNEFREKLGPVFEALGESFPQAHDSIDGIAITEKEMVIYYSYIVRQCDYDGDTRCPLSVLEAEDPVKAAKLYKAEADVSSAIDDLHRCEEALKSAQKQYCEAANKLVTLRAWHQL